VLTDGGSTENKFGQQFYRNLLRQCYNDGRTDGLTWPFHYGHNLCPLYKSIGIHANIKSITSYIQSVKKYKVYFTNLDLIP